MVVLGVGTKSVPSVHAVDMKFAQAKLERSEQERPRTIQGEMVVSPYACRYSDLA